MPKFVTIQVRDEDTLTRLKIALLGVPGAEITEDDEPGEDPGWELRPVTELKAGDRYYRSNTMVTVLTEPERGTETVPPLAGRPCLRVYARREDNGKTGTVTFGLAAQVQFITSSQEAHA